MPYNVKTINLRNSKFERTKKEPTLWNNIYRSIVIVIRHGRCLSKLAMKFRGRILDKWAKLPRTFVFIARDRHHGTFLRALSRADIGLRACHKKRKICTVTRTASTSLLITNYKTIYLKLQKLYVNGNYYTLGVDSAEKKLACFRWNVN